MSIVRLIINNDFIFSSAFLDLNTVLQSDVFLNAPCCSSILQELVNLPSINVLNLNSCELISKLIVVSNNLSYVLDFIYSKKTAFLALLGINEFERLTCILKLDTRNATIGLGILEHSFPFVFTFAMKLALSSQLLCNANELFQNFPSIFHSLINNEFIIPNLPMNPALLLQNQPNLTVFLRECFGDSSFVHQSTQINYIFANIK